MGWLWSAAENELDFPRWAALCRRRELCPPVDVLVAGYLGWKPPQRITPIKVDREAEDAAFAAAMSGFDAGDKTPFQLPGGM